MRRWQRIANELKKLDPNKKIKGDRCPICSTLFNTVNHRQSCVHVVWHPKTESWILANQSKGHESAQEQKYAINPRWRYKVYDTNPKRNRLGTTRLK